MATHAEVDQQKLTWLNYAVAIFAGIGSFLFGYDSGIISSVISPQYIQFHRYFNEPTDNETGAVVSLLAGGCFFGALIAGYTANKIGRKRTIQLGSIVAIIGCAIQTGAVNLGMLMAGRFIAGIAIGILSMIVPLYQAEISPPHARGLLSGWTQLMISFGFFIANWVGYGCESLDNDGQWRIPLAIQIVPAIFLLFGMFLLPYSPRWLAQQGRDSEALAALQRLHGSKVNSAAVAAEYAEIVAQIHWERENVSSNFRDLFNTKANLHRTACGCLVQICTQLTGVNVNSYFGPTIYGNLGFSGSTVLLINGISGAWGMIVTYCFITFFVDRFGRRQPLIYGGFAMAVFLAWQAGVGALFQSKTQNGTVVYDNRSAGIAGIASIFLFSGAFAFSYGPVSWIYQSEVFSMPLRSMGTSISTASNWATNVLLSQVTPIALSRINWRYFILYVCTNICNGILAYFLFPETKGKTLEELGAIFGDENIVRPPNHVDAVADLPVDEEKTSGAGHKHTETV